tara:strand:+ start:160 stop:984 length:825 start_codon:yes stop_codon:yes gene_type:complete
MEEKEDEESLIRNTSAIQLEKIKLFNVIKLKFPNKFLLSLFNWKKLMLLTWGIQLMFFISFAGLMKPNWNSNAKISIIIAAFGPIVEYASILLNMYNGGWGKEDSSFWCHMRIMFLSGYNSIRWSISAVVDTALVFAICIINENTVSNSVKASINIVYCYYILANREQKKSQPIEWEKFKDDFDVKLEQVHQNQKLRTKSVGVEPIILCFILTSIPWLFDFNLMGLFIISYQICICANAYRYCSTLQTFVVTDIQYDIIQIIFRTLILWIFIWA